MLDNLSEYTLMALIVLFGLICIAIGHALGAMRRNAYWEPRFNAAMKRSAELKSQLRKNGLFIVVAIAMLVMSACARTTDGSIDWSAKGLNADAAKLAQYYQDYSNGAAAQLVKMGIGAVCPECMIPVNLALGALDVAAAGIVAAQPEAATEAYLATKELNTAVANLPPAVTE